MFGSGKMCIPTELWHWEFQRSECTKLKLGGCSKCKSASPRGDVPLTSPNGKQPACCDIEEYGAAACWLWLWNTTQWMPFQKMSICTALKQTDDRSITQSKSSAAYQWKVEWKEIVSSPWQLADSSFTYNTQDQRTCLCLVSDRVLTIIHGTRLNSVPKACLFSSS